MTVDPGGEMRDRFVEFRLASDDLSAVRFGISPGYELCHAVRVLIAPEQHPLQWGWLRVAARLVPGPAFELLRLVVGHDGYLPDFLTSSPGWDLTPDLERERLHAADLTAMRLDLGKRADREEGRAREVLLGLREDPERARDTVAKAWGEFWEAVLAPSWPALDRMLQADIGSRSRRVMRHGLGEMVGSLHEAIGWGDSAVRVRLAQHEEILDCRGSGLVLVPSVMSRRCAALTEPPAQPTLFYPALGVTERWSESVGARDAAVTALLGAGRARLLLALREPMTTTEAAAAVGTAISTASHHLAILRAAGLVDSHRAGAAVLHARTPTGDALISGSK